MGLLDFLADRRARLEGPVAGASRFGKMRTERDNWIVNKSKAPVTVIGSEIFGPFRLDLSPGEKRRITFDVEADVYLQDQYSSYKVHDDPEYKIGQHERWEVRMSKTGPYMRKVKG